MVNIYLYEKSHFFSRHYNKVCASSSMTAKWGYLYIVQCIFANKNLKILVWAVYVERISGANIWHQQTKSKKFDSFRLLLATFNVPKKVSQWNKNLHLRMNENWCFLWRSQEQCGPCGDYEMSSRASLFPCVSTNHWVGARTDEAELCDLIYDWLLQVL